MDEILARLHAVETDQRNSRRSGAASELWKGKDVASGTGMRVDIPGRDLDRWKQPLLVIVIEANVTRVAFTEGSFASGWFSGKGLRWTIEEKGEGSGFGLREEEQALR